jgi:hypothetical protein
MSARSNEGLAVAGLALAGVRAVKRAARPARTALAGVLADKRAAGAALAGVLAGKRAAERTAKHASLATSNLAERAGWLAADAVIRVAKIGRIDVLDITASLAYDDPIIDGPSEEDQ